MLWLSVAVVGAQAPTATPPAIRVYSSDIHDLEGVEIGPAPAALTLIGTRGGVFSGKIIIESDAPLMTVEGTPTELRSGSSVIPAGLCQVRYAAAWDDFTGFFAPSGPVVLHERPLPQVAPDRSGKARLPVWLTVRVPRDAAPGAYTGRLSLRSANGPLAEVPVTLEVGLWTLPPTQEYTTWIELIQSPDTLAVEYRLPLWSERHWEMMAKSFRHIGEIGSRVVYVPLIAKTNQGHSETMVRWIRRPDGTYDHDFSILDRYLDTAERNMGRPKMVVFYAWEVFLAPPSDEFVEQLRTKNSSDTPRMEARAAYRGKGPPVTVFDPATGATETVLLPPYHDPSARGLWKPVWDGIRERMRRRGLEDAMMLGMLTDWRPTDEDAAVLRELSGDIPWASCSHHAPWMRETASPAAIPVFKKTGRIGYTAMALSFQLNVNPERERHYGWKKAILHAQYWRDHYFIRRPLSACRHAAELQITGEQRGLAHLGADFWFCIRDRQGRRRASLTDIYPESYWHNLSIVTSLLAPGAEGPVATAHYEALREGIQECEARIAIEKVLTDPAARARIGEALATRAQVFLDEKHRNAYRAHGLSEEALASSGFINYRDYYNDLSPKMDSAAGSNWFIRSGWAQRTGRLFALAREVEEKKPCSPRFEHPRAVVTVRCNTGASGCGRTSASRRIPALREKVRACCARPRDSRDRA